MTIIYVWNHIRPHSHFCGSEILNFFFYSGYISALLYFYFSSKSWKKKLICNIKIIIFSVLGLIFDSWFFFFCVCLIKNEIREEKIKKKLYTHIMHEVGNIMCMKLFLNLLICNNLKMMTMKTRRKNYFYIITFFFFLNFVYQEAG